MTTLPPEGQQGDDAQGGAPEQPQAPQPPQQPQAPQAPEQPQQHQAPQAPQAPQPPQASQPPQAPQPGQPQQPQYQAPPQQQQYQAPPQGGGYQQPQQPYGAPQQQYGAPQQPYGQAVVNPVGNLQLNYWLSVFFSWIPALIFFLVDKDKGDQRLRQLHAANLNFTLLRIFAIIAAYIVFFIFIFIPYVGPFLGWLVLMVAIWGGLILHIIGAAKVAQAYQNGQPVDPFLFNLPMVK